MTLSPAAAPDHVRVAVVSVAWWIDGSEDDAASLAGPVVVHRLINAISLLLLLLPAGTRDWLPAIRRR